jgi:transcriptional regulator with XRE-family HTH domain
LRELAARAGTSHSTLAAYEAGRVVPSVETLDRIVRAAGFALGTQLEVRIGDHTTADRGRELEQVLELAAMFPARHSATLLAPVFPAR